MSTKDLNEYLKIVVDLEKNIYIQKQTLQAMEKQANRLAVPKDIPEPVQKQTPDNGFVGTLSWGIFLTLFLPVIYFFGLDVYYWPVSALEDSGSDFFASILAIILSLIALAAIPGFFVGLFCLFSGLDKKFKCNQALNQNNSDYQRALSQYNYEKEKDNSRMLTERIQKSTLLSEIRIMRETHKHSQESLNTVYFQNIIFPKYRNLIAVCSLYEYISSGRCNELQGPNGAYNLYEQEIRADRIITQLDHISSQLSQIQRNQYILYQSVRNIDDKCSQLLDANAHVLNSIQGLQQTQEQSNERINHLIANSSIGIYQRERIQKELEYMNRMDYLTGRNNGVFYNDPPSYHRY